MQRKYRNPFPNYLRTKEQRRARYCFLRQSGLNTNIARIVVAYRDTRISMFLENNGSCKA